MATLQQLSDEHAEQRARIKEADEALTERFAGKLRVNHDLDRTLVSFQANREESGNRWCKYREGFSAELVRYIILRTGITGGAVLDPFAGSGATLFAAAEQGLNAIGIELLPCSAEIIEVRHAIQSSNRRVELARKMAAFAASRAWTAPGPVEAFNHLRITRGAFPEQTELALGRFLHEVHEVSEPLLSRVLRFAAMCVLEQISFTRKDGQYLRWDQRSGRSLGKRGFDKGRIDRFDDAITAKISQIADDLMGNSLELELFPTRAPVAPTGTIEVRAGSCLDILQQLATASVAGVITSPPYCNRYDYTRTYALELAMLNVTEDRVRALRQAMLSCTVENRDKDDLAAKFSPKVFDAATEALRSQPVLSLVLEYLERCRIDQTLNNPGIVRMVRNYFTELTLLVFTANRILKRGAPFVMVNDNVRYAGAHIPVDLILADIAEKAGYEVEAIWVLPKGKGNSSQQMGMHGRQELRKCVYVWRKR